MKPISIALISMIGFIFRPTPAFCEMQSWVYSVTVRTSSGSVRGYLVLPIHGFDATASDALEKIRQVKYPLYIYESMELTAKMPSGQQFFITTIAPRQIPPNDFLAISALKSDWNGAVFGEPTLVSPKQATLLKKPPLAFCAGTIWDGDYWISYDSGRAPMSGEIAQRNLIGEEFILTF